MRNKLLQGQANAADLPVEICAPARSGNVQEEEQILEAQVVPVVSVCRGRIRPAPDHSRAARVVSVVGAGEWKRGGHCIIIAGTAKRLAISSSPPRIGTNVLLPKSTERAHRRFRSGGGGERGEVRRGSGEGRRTCDGDEEEEGERARSDERPRHRRGRRAGPPAPRSSGERGAQTRGDLGRAGRGEEGGRSRCGGALKGRGGGESRARAVAVAGEGAQRSNAPRYGGGGPAVESRGGRTAPAAFLGSTHSLLLCLSPRFACALVPWRRLFIRFSSLGSRALAR